MIELKLLRNNLEDIAANLAMRGFTLDKAKFNSLEEKRSKLQAHTQDLQSKRNALAKEVGMIKAKGGDASSVMQESSKFAEDLKKSEQELEALLVEQQSFIAHLPNILHETVPLGQSEDDNQELRVFGQIPKFDFTPLDHVSIGERFNGLSTALGAKLAGSRFVVLQGSIAKLHRALAQFMLDLHTEEHSYTETYVPYIVGSDALFGTGQLPKFAEDAFKLDEDKNMYLIPTSEAPLTNLVSNEIINEEDLPLRYVAHSPCFRREAGSYGKDTHGMFRVHQFDKVELVQIVKPENSYQALEEIIGHAEKVLQKLELPYRVMTLCSKDTGATACKTYDIEVWLPGQNSYREVSSCSNTESYQARRMHARYKSKDMKKPDYVHTLNGSGIAIGRALIAVLENYQDKDGNIRVPKVLQKYLGGKTLLEI